MYSICKNKRREPLRSLELCKKNKSREIVAIGIKEMYTIRTRIIHFIDFVGSCPIVIVSVFISKIRTSRANTPTWYFAYILGQTMKRTGLETLGLFGFVLLN